MRILTYVLRGFIFFVLVAFAINNQQPVTVNWFFSYAWTAPSASAGSQAGSCSRSMTRSSSRRSPPSATRSLR